MRTLTNEFFKDVNKTGDDSKWEDILKKYLMNQSWLYKTWSLMQIAKYWIYAKALKIDVFVKTKSTDMKAHWNSEKSSRLTTWGEEEKSF